MNILIYTDGTLIKRGEGLAISVILSETHYIGLVVQKCKSAFAPEAELFAIHQSLKYLDERNILCDKMLLFTDAEYWVVVYNNIMNSGGYIPPKIENKEIWRYIISIARKYKLSFEYIVGHQIDHNPNKLCDIMGRVHTKCGTDTLVLG